VLTSPFSSLVGIVAEYGLLGTLLVGWFFVSLMRLGVRTWRRPDSGDGWRATGAALAFSILLLAVLSCFDSYFEQPVVVIPIATLWLLASMAPPLRAQDP
jgi:O-antigen ligase